MTVYEIVADVAQKLEALDIPYAVGGSLASSVWGQMRQTNDADFVVRLPISAVAELEKAFGPPYYLSMSEVILALSSSEDFRSFQLLHMDEAFKIDLFLLGDSAYASSELQRAMKVEVSPLVWVRFYAPENIVITKLRWFALGNRISDRQWNDIVQVLDTQRGVLDDAYLDDWANHFGLLALLNDARSQAYS